MRGGALWDYPDAVRVVWIQEGFPNLGESCVARAQGAVLGDSDLRFATRPTAQCLRSLGADR